MMDGLKSVTEWGFVAPRIRDKSLESEASKTKTQKYFATKEAAAKASDSFWFRTSYTSYM